MAAEYTQPFTAGEPYIRLDEIAAACPPRETKGAQRWAWCVPKEGPTGYTTDEIILHIAYRN